AKSPESRAAPFPHHRASPYLPACVLRMACPRGTSLTQTRSQPFEEVGVRTGTVLKSRAKWAGALSVMAVTLFSAPAVTPTRAEPAAAKQSVLGPGLYVFQTRTR